MKLKGFGISNYRSFDEEGIMLEGLKKINIIIGKNNCGKSNILRFLHTLNSNINDLRNFPNDIQNQHRRNGTPSKIIIKLKGSELIVQQDNLRRFRDWNYNVFLNKSWNLYYDFLSQVVNLPEDFANLSNNQLISFQGKYSSAPTEDLKKAVIENWSNKIKSIIKLEFRDLIYIPHLRVIQEGHSFGDSNSSINGSNIISKMFAMQNPEIGQEKSRDKFNLIQNFVRELINKPKLKIEIPHTQKEIVLTIDGVRQPLDAFGTGIHQLVILCSTLVIHENSIVCIEEPEIHLHPELQRKFLNFLHKTKNTYFITTHSNTFLNSNNNTSIYHVKNDGLKSTIQLATRNETTFSILNDLGYKSSDILQTNGVIWVEGPSDRTYLLQWLKILTPELMEGIHFSVMFYGGKLLSHLSFEKEKVISDLIPLLKLNQNAFVLMDRDGFTSKAKLTQTKQRVKAEIGERNYWVTKGREIENYLTEKSLRDWLNLDSITIDENTKLEDLVPKSAKIKYNTSKSTYAKQIAEHITIDDLEILDLKTKLNQLIKTITSWN
ncbi:ATP-dependent nuclease [Marinifilum flexuosum]|uniref:ATP-dependent nuclease n=1 Tax=Marinifilum flexuosum TaxID=1117708 RepID=UPI0024949FCC|nr:ATP-binding protein [Marinifilum flexuosum]